MTPTETHRLRRSMRRNRSRPARHTDWRGLLLFEQGAPMPNGLERTTEPSERKRRIAADIRPDRRRTA